MKLRYYKPDFNIGFCFQGMIFDQAWKVSLGNAKRVIADLPDAQFDCRLWR